jgi:xanthine dehydrogenase accessory factor
MVEVWKHALQSISEGRRTVLVVVVDHEGSVPGTTGATMVVSHIDTAGTVGGGVAEHEMIERARAFQGTSELIDIEHTPDASGSLCSGSHTLALVALTTEHRAVVESIATTLEQDGVGLLRLSEQGLFFTPGERATQRYDASGWSFETTLGRLDTLYIVGGGHCALALSRVMATLPFRIVVLDDRPELPTMAQNRFAHETRIIDYQYLAEHVDEGDRSWVVVMTFGHAADETALRVLAETPLRYIGLLGSAAKVQQIFTRMRDDGVPERHLERVSAPIGLPIGSHTPEEIAISIAAEIIREQNQGTS